MSNFSSLILILSSLFLSLAPENSYGHEGLQGRANFNDLKRLEKAEKKITKLLRVPTSEAPYVETPIWDSETRPNSYIKGHFQAE